MECSYCVTFLRLEGRSVFPVGLKVWLWTLLRLERPSVSPVRLKLWKHCYSRVLFLFKMFLPADT